MNATPFLRPRLAVTAAALTMIYCMSAPSPGDAFSEKVHWRDRRGLNPPTALFFISLFNF
jgi:hypothetical protein